LGTASKLRRRLWKEIDMKASRWFPLGIVAALCACSSQASHDEAPAAGEEVAAAPALHETSAEAAGPSSEAPDEKVRPVEETGISPEADAIARAMCDTLRDAKRFSFRAETTMDRMLSNGSMIEIPAGMDITVRRPDGIRVDRRGVRGHRLVQYDGKQLGVLDLDKKLYVQGEAPPTIDETIDALEKRFDIVLPLSDLCAEDPYVAFSEEFADDGTLLGVFPYRGKSCDVLAYRNESIDWQVWVAREGPRVPLRLTIRYETEPGVPRFTADLSDWNLSASATDADFTFSPPADAKKIEVHRRDTDTVAASEEAK
jgi:hypothetical protein